MESIYWYCLLAIIGIGIAAFSIYKKRDIAKVSTYLVFYLFATCVTWIGEFVVLGLFDSYAYKTGLFTSPWAQNIFVCILKKWFWKLVPFVIAFVGQSILVKLNILVLQDGWTLFNTMLVYFMSIMTFILIENYSLNPKETIV